MDSIMSFLLQIFFMNHIPPKSLKITLGSFRIISKFPEIFESQGTPPVSMTLAANFATSFAGVVDTGGKLTLVSTMHQRQIWHRYQWHRWQTMGTISDWETWRKKFIYIYANSTSDWRFFHLPPVTTTPHRWCTLSCEYLCEFSKKFETA